VYRRRCEISSKHADAVRQAGHDHDHGQDAERSELSGT
jgi:hypothetical protein